MVRTFRNVCILFLLQSMPQNYSLLCLCTYVVDTTAVRHVCRVGRRSAVHDPAMSGGAAYMDARVDARRIDDGDRSAFKGQGSLVTNGCLKDRWRSEICTQRSGSQKDLRRCVHHTSWVQRARTRVADFELSDMRQSDKMLP